MGYTAAIAKPTHSFTLEVGGTAYDPQQHVYVNVAISVTGTADGKLKTVIHLDVKGGDVSIQDYGTFSVSRGSGELVRSSNFISLHIWVTPKYGGKVALWIMVGNTGTLSGQTLQVSPNSNHVTLPIAGHPRLDNLSLTGTITPVY
jgi:hypothetical protein